MMLSSFPVCAMLLVLVLVNMAGLNVVDLPVFFNLVASFNALIGVPSPTVCGTNCCDMRFRCLAIFVAIAIFLLLMSFSSCESLSGSNLDIDGVGEVLLGLVTLKLYLVERELRY